MPNSSPEPHLVYQHEGRTFSRFSAGIPKGAELVNKGWTVAHADGTRGIGRQPFATEAEAQAWCDAHPHFPGMSQG
jgi:hypothetical protein